MSIPNLLSHNYRYYKPQKEKPAKADEKTSCTDVRCLVAVLQLFVCAAGETEGFLTVGSE